MATKITIDELVTKYTFEVDLKGAKTYEEALDKVEKKGKSAAEEETKARKKAAASQAKVTEKTSRARERALERGVKATERAVKRSERATERAAKRTARTVAREAKRGTVARELAAAAALKGDATGFALATKAAQRAQAAQTAAVARGSRARERAERRSQREIRRASKRTTRAIERDALRQERAVKGAARRKQRSEALSGAAGGLGGLGAAGGPAAAAGVAALAGAATAISVVGDETARLDKIAKGAQISGLGIPQYQKLSQVATLAGADVDTLAKGTIKLDRNLNDVADGSGKKIVDALARLNLTAADFEGKDQTEKLALLSDAISKVDDDAQKTVLAIELMGKSGSDLVPLLNSGSTAIREMSDSVGRVFTAEELAKAESYQDQLANLDKTLSVVKGSFVLAFAPAFEKAAAAVERAIPPITEFISKLIDQLAPAFERLVKAAKPWVERSGPGLEKLLGQLLAPLEAAAKGLAVLANQIAFLLEVGETVSTWIESFLEQVETRWPRAFNIAAAVVNAIVSPLETVSAVLSRIFDFIERSVNKIDGLAGKVAEIRAALGVSGPEDTEDDQKEKKEKESQQRTRTAQGAEAKLKAQEADIRARRAKESEQDASQAQAQAQAQKGGRRKKKGKGKGGKKPVTGLEAQIEQQFKSVSDAAELRESARALSEGFDADTAFQLGKDAAKATEERLRTQFEETGDLPAGIARDVQQLARSPAVEEAIGKVAPPVISVKNEVTNVTISGNDFITQLETTLTGANARDISQQNAKAILQILGQEIGVATRNMEPQEQT